MDEINLFKCLIGIAAAALVSLWIFYRGETKEQDQWIDYLTYYGSKEFHEKEGDRTCPECGKKYVADIDYCTHDYVMNMDTHKTEVWNQCPHCKHTWTKPAAWMD